MRIQVYERGEVSLSKLPPPRFLAPQPSPSSPKAPTMSYGVIFCGTTRRELQDEGGEGEGDAKLGDRGCSRVEALPIFLPPDGSVNPSLPVSLISVQFLVSIPSSWKVSSLEIRINGLLRVLLGHLGCCKGFTPTEMRIFSEIPPVQKAFQREVLPSAFHQRFYPRRVIVPFPPLHQSRPSHTSACSRIHVREIPVVTSQEFAADIWE
ncbi:hypothetical protein Taro_042190 [Colocasia esculenta]|uniref:Uncharacterized protein n=1 Tax=Colocasia esculenta TaxID=4460 RepID=A0A843X227_COLES|nr:hypothetical protein [Colocasia esculenta]